MKNNKIIPENKNEVKKNMPEANIIPNMEALGFECLLEAKKHTKFSSTSKYYLFLKPDIGLCEIDTYEGKASTINLSLNYQNKNSNDFHRGFSYASWGSSTGTPSGYGYSVKVGSLTVNGDLQETIAEMKRKGRFIFPFVERNFHINEDVFSEEEKQKNVILQDINGRTQWFIENRVKESNQKFFGSHHSESIQDIRDVLGYWDDYIRWNYTSQDKDKIDRIDKQFYTICKDIITKDIEDIKPLIDKNFIYQTTSLGQNFCHLMSIIQDPAKKELLWNTFQTLSVSHQTNFITHNDLNGYNPLLILVQHVGIKPIKDNQMNLEYFNKYLSVKDIDLAFVNEKNSLLDCLTYSSSLDANKPIDYLSKLIENGLAIPLVYLKKKQAFSSEQKVIERSEGEKIKDSLNPYVFNFINAVNLKEKISKDLPQKDIDNAKLKKI
jgi:hypothetical protein